MTTRAVYQPRRFRLRLRKLTFSRFMLYVLLTVLVVIAGLPLFAMVCRSLMPLDELYIYPPRLIVRKPTLRNFSDESEARCLELISKHVRAVEVAYGVKCSIVPRCHYLPVINDAHAAARVRKAAGDMAVSASPLTISEDFSFYQRAVKGAFFFCGTAQGKKYSAPLHSPEFAFDERSLLNGLKVFISLLDFAN